MQRFAIQYHTMERRVKLWKSVPFNAMQQHAMSCQAMPCNAMACYDMQCHVMQRHAMSCHATHDHALMVFGSYDQVAIFGAM